LPKVEDWNWETIVYGHYRQTVFTQLKIDRKSAILHQRGHFDPKFLVQGVAPHQ